MSRVRAQGHELLGGVFVAPVSGEVQRRAPFVVLRFDVRAVLSKDRNDLIYWRVRPVDGHGVERRGGLVERGLLAGVVCIEVSAVGEEGLSAGGGARRRCPVEGRRAVGVPSVGRRMGLP